MSAIDSMLTWPIEDGHSTRIFFAHAMALGLHVFPLNNGVHAFRGTMRLRLPARDLIAIASPGCRDYRQGCIRRIDAALLCYNITSKPGAA